MDKWLNHLKFSSCGYIALVLYLWAEILILLNLVFLVNVSFFFYFNAGGTLSGSFSGKTLKDLLEKILGSSLISTSSIMFSGDLEYTNEYLNTRASVLSWVQRISSSISM